MAVGLGSSEVEAIVVEGLCGAEVEAVVVEGLALVVSGLVTWVEAVKVGGRGDESMLSEVSKLTTTGAEIGLIGDRVTVFKLGCSGVVVRSSDASSATKVEAIEVEGPAAVAVTWLDVYSGAS